MANANYYSSFHASDRFTSCSETSSDAEASTPRIRIFDRFYNSPENDEPTVSSISPSPEKSPLPEFAGSGFGTGIFGPPARFPVHPNRPPCLEIRPHLTRESQAGRFLRNITCVSGGGVNKRSELWAGSECGVRAWDLGGDLYGVENTDKEYGTMRYFESVRVGSPALCLVGCGANGVVWTGHSDGKVRCWKMMRSVSKSGKEKGKACDGFKEIVAWQAHQGPVLSMVVSSYGDIWSGSEGGSIKIWPWEAMEKSLALANEQRPMAALMVERSYIDLKKQVALANGACCSIFSSDVRIMLSDHVGAKVWSASYHSFALWDARTKDLLKVLSINGEIESIPSDPLMEDEAKSPFISTPKEKLQNSFSFFQRSRNAILGAADAVLRAATKGGCEEDSKRIEAFVSTPDGNVWMGFANGLLVQWDGNGSQIQDVQYYPYSVQCMCTVGSRIWVGYDHGMIQVLDLNGDLLGEWVGHSSPIIGLAVGSGYVFSLANHGGIRGWSVTSPGPLNDILRTELSFREFSYTRIEKLKILAGTWNVGEGKASHDSLISWLGSAVAGIDVVVVGLQEVEMGAGFLAVSAAKETLQMGVEGSSAGQWWLEMIGRTLDEGSTFTCVGSRQLAGLLIAVWVRNKIQAHVGDVDVAAVPCGLGRAIGNKGAVGMRMRIYGRVVCFVNCHFAAHLEAVNRRNADFDHVYRTMVFDRPPNGSNPSQTTRHANGGPVANSMDGLPELSDADMVVFLGDFNYRLNDISYDQARDFVSQRSFDWLREMDQLRAEMKSGNAFQGMREADIRFPPTYKFEKYQPGLAGYDSGEKKRIPAWCDRILYRDSRSASLSTCSLECPVVSSASQYDACMDVTDSDHKPVRCIFEVEVARVKESVRRRVFGEIMRSNREVRRLLEEQYKVPEIIMSTNNIILQNQDESILRITNKGKKDTAVFQIICQGVSAIDANGKASERSTRGSFGFPRWLQVKPSRGIIEADHIMEVSIRHEEYQTVEEFVDGVPLNSWCEDARDKEVMLVIKVHGPTEEFEDEDEEEIQSHRVCVRYSITATKLPPISQKPESSSNPIGSSLLHRSDFKISSSCDVVDHLRKLYTP